MTALPEIAPPAFDPPYPTAGGRFAPGDVVRVRKGAAPGHMRTPYYLRGRTGRIERICGDFANPEELAYRRDGRPAKTLYRVRFTMALTSSIKASSKGRTNSGKLGSKSFNVCS